MARPHPVGRDFSPNMTFSVLYVKDGDYVFQNAGIAVAQPAIALTVKSDKAVYAPARPSRWTSAAPSTASRCRPT